MIGIYDFVDTMCAEALGVSVETYINKIERTTEYRIEVITNACWEADEAKIAKAKRIFNLIQ